MSGAAPARQPPFGNKVPYVGPRPFRPDEGDRFFGRDGDAQILCDRILTGRLTILYAPSGLGKSSLLQARVIPKLEASNARVVYFDAWAQEAPLRALKEELVALASRLGVPDAGRGSPTLVELVRLVDDVDEQGVVLVLDQFEDFLVHHGQALDPLRSELAALVRASRVDAAVVLSLREEFLAALEPFRQEILNLFQSAYRLEALSEAGLREAICRPAEKCEGGCQPELADQLIRDLRGGPSEPSAGGLSFVGLPMLQLVCQELWKNAADRQLSLELYQRMGGAQRIIDEYVRGLMPKRRREQSLTARLLVHLAPPSGLKMSYAVQDLAATTGLAPAAVTAELERLSDALVLRTRQYRSGKRYELEHDVFIPVLSKWRDRVLDRCRSWKMICRTACTALAVAALTAAVGTYIHLERSAGLEKELADLKLKQEERRRRSEEQKREESELAHKQLEEWVSREQLRQLRDSDMSLKERQASAASRFDSVATFFLWRKKGVQRLNELKATLLENQDLLPRDYAVQTSTEEQAPDDADWPLKLEYSSAIRMHPGEFGLMWRDRAKEMAERWSIPVPRRVGLAPRRNLPKESVRVMGEGVKAVELTIPTYDSRLLIRSSPAVLDDTPAREFLEHFKGDWTPFPPRKDWRLVPQWSLPVWKAAGQAAVSPSGMAAYLVVEQLLDKPEMFLSTPAMARLLKHARDMGFEATVDEARAARGSQLEADLAERLRQWGGALFLLPDILDQLGESPVGRAQAESKMPTVPEREPGLFVRLRGPWPKLGGEATGRESAAFGEDRAFRDWEERMPPFVHIRVYVAERFVPEWFPKGELSPALSTGIEAVRDDLYSFYGVRVPGFRFSRAAAGGTLPNNAIRMFVQTERELRANREWLIDERDTLESLLKVLRYTAQEARFLWVTPESTQEALKRLPPEMQEWLARQYSLTDLKVLLRELIAPASQRRAASARYAHWLLSSLFFWALVDSPFETKTMRTRLLETQEAWARSRSVDIRDEIRQPIERGINELLKDNYSSDTAKTEFERAIKRDRTAAMEAFCTLWSRRLPEVWLRDFRRGHDSLQNLRLSRTERLDLEELAGRLDPQRDAKTWSEVSRYRLAAKLVANQSERAALLRDILAHHDPREKWPTEHARWTAMEFLKQYDPLKPQTGDARLLGAAGSLLKRAVVDLEQGPAHEAFRELIRITLESRGPNWGWRLLDELADARPGGVDNSLPLELAWRLCNDERRERLTRALSLIGRFEKELKSSKEVSKEDRGVHTENINYVRAKAYQGLARQGDVQLLGEAERLCSDLLESKWGGIANEAHLDLMRLFYEAGRDEQAQALSRRAREKWKDDPRLHSVEFFAQVLRGRVSSVANLAESALQRAKPGDEDQAAWLYLAALGTMLTQSPAWQDVTERFLKEDHPYRDYILMMFHAYAGGRSGLLDKRWAEIDPKTWQDRLRNGDVSAWREMLIGRLLDKPESARLFEILEDEQAWLKSELSQVELSRHGQRCEAWFYEAMRAKAEQERERMVEYLRRCVGVGFESYYEHKMSLFLLSQMR